MNPQKLTLYTAIAIALAAIGIIIYYNLQPANSTPLASNVEINYDGQPSLGDTNAPVKVVAFEDFKCPACRNFETEVFPQLENEYIKTGQVEFYFINYPFLGPDSTTAALAAECAYQQNTSAFWDYKSVIYRSQGIESQTWATPRFLAELADVNVPALDAAELRSCIEAKTFEPDVIRDKQMGDDLNVPGTPTIYVNGNQLPSYAYGTIKNAIDAELNN